LTLRWQSVASFPRAIVDHLDDALHDGFWNRVGPNRFQTATSFGLYTCASGVDGS
jgi:hypothetical protein